MRYHNHLIKTVIAYAAALAIGPDKQSERTDPKSQGHGKRPHHQQGLGETLIGAGVITDGGGAATNTYGFYTLTNPQGKEVSLKYSYVGYDDVTLTLDLLRDTTVNVALKANSELKEAVVSAQRESRIMATKMSAIEFL